jgi:uncharacterized repeat protein (TIGR01451 family)
LAQSDAATAGGQLTGSQLIWNLGNLDPKDSQEACVTLTGTAPGTLALTATAQGVCATEVAASSQTTIRGIPAILLEVVDIEDPIEVGSEVIYEIIVTNQGSEPAANVKLVCAFEEEQQFVSASGVSDATLEGNTVRFAEAPTIPAKGKAVWRVKVKAVKAGSVRFKAAITSEYLTRTVEETEATNQY